MTIEETYKGMWSSDPDLLKSLLDVGETIIGKHAAGFFASIYSEDEEYWYRVEDTVFQVKHRFNVWSFLIPPRPLVLEPKPLKWKQKWNDEIATDGKWRYWVKDGGYWEVWCEGKCGRYRIGEGVAKNGNFDTAKAAIHEWRVNHLKSMLT